MICEKTTDIPIKNPAREDPVPGFACFAHWEASIKLSD